MPYTAKQTRFFQAVAHGMRPTKSSSSLTADKAKELLSHDEAKEKAKRKGQERALAKL